MGLKKKVTHRLDIPHESGAWIEFREVGWKTLERARDARVHTAVGKYRDFGAELIKSVQEAQGDNAPDVEPDATDEYDQTIMLHNSIIAWSYTEAVTMENIDELDELTATWAMGVIVGFYVHDEEAEGKGSSPSSVSYLGTTE